MQSDKMHCGETMSRFKMSGNTAQHAAAKYEAAKRQLVQ